MNHWCIGKLHLKNISGIIEQDREHNLYPLHTCMSMHTHTCPHVHTPAQTQKIKKHDKGLNFWKGLPFLLGRPARQVGLKIPRKLKLAQHKMPVIIMAESTGESVCGEASNWPPPVALGLDCDASYLSSSLQWTTVPSSPYVMDSCCWRWMTAENPSSCSQWP